MLSATCATAQEDARSLKGKRNHEINTDEYALKKADWELLIDQSVIGRNAVRNRAILKASMLDGYTYEQIAELLIYLCAKLKTLSIKPLKNL